MSKSKTINIGVIGYGLRGDLVEHAHQPESGYKLVALADLREVARQRFAEKFGSDVMLTDDYHQMLQRDDIDAVFVNSPDYLHEQHTVDCLRAGKHVYLEKPMANDIDGCDNILRTAKQTGCKLYLGHNMRHMPFVNRMKQLIDEGAIGQVKTVWCRHFVSYGGDAYYKDWHAERDKCFGLLLQKGAHDIDVIHWLCGAYTSKVNAMGALMVYDQVEDRHAPGEYEDIKFEVENWPPLKQTGMNPVIEVEDVSMMHMQLSNGVLATYQQCQFSPDAWRNYTVIGTEGRLENIGDYAGQCVIKLWNKRRHGYDDQADEQFVIDSGDGGHGGGDVNIVNEFLRYVRDGGETLTTPVAARMAVATGYQATLSLRNGGVPMDVPPVPEDIR